MIDGERDKERSRSMGRRQTSCSSCSLVATRYCSICEHNPTKRAVKITSTRSSEFTSDIIIEGVKYHVQTEKISSKKPIVMTCVFKAGEIISSKKIDYSHMKPNDLARMLPDLMQRQHMAAIKLLKEEKPRTGKIPSDYLEEVKGLLKTNDNKGALKMLRSALSEHPFNPFLLSYYGCLEAVVEKNYDRGTEVCKDAIEILNEEVPFGKEVFYPVFYLNLGRAYLVGGKRKYATEAFQKGLEADPEDQDLLFEVKKLGVRKKPPIPFLKRSNPMNKYIGLLMGKIKSA